jgi:hypothetical protein
MQALSDGLNFYQICQSLIEKCSPVVSFITHSNGTCSLDPQHVLALLQMIASVRGISRSFIFLFCSMRMFVYIFCSGHL